MSDAGRERFFVLRRAPLGERDDLVHCLGEQRGLFSASVRGSRGGSRAWRAGLLEPPVELEGVWRQGGSLDHLSQLRLVRPFAGIRRSLERLQTAGFVGRLFRACVPEGVPAEEFYRLLGEFFERLADGRSVVATAWLAQLAVLEESGCALVLEGCALCGDSRVALYSPTHGGVLCARCPAGPGSLSLSPQGHRVLREMQAGIWQESLPERSVMTEVGRVLKLQLQTYLEVPASLFRPVLTAAPVVSRAGIRSEEGRA